MIKKNKDSKFVIYQVLYIFVITVLAIKGANLDLGEVISKDKAVKTSVRDSLITVIDSLNASGLKFDIKIDESAAKENVTLKKKIEDLKTNVASLVEKIKEAPKPVEQKPVNTESKQPSNIDYSSAQSPLAEGQSFYQNTWNIASNSSSMPVQILDPASRSVITGVAPGEKKKFDLLNQKEIIVKYGNREERIAVLPKRPPEIKIEPVTTKMNNSDIYVQDLQKTSVFKVTITDIRPDQLNINYNGPINVAGPIKDSKGNLVYNVSLKLANNEQKFDEWMSRNNPLRESNGKYKVNFFFTAVDKITKNKVQVGDSFYFTDFQK